MMQAKLRNLPKNPRRNSTKGPHLHENTNIGAPQEKEPPHVKILKPDHPNDLQKGDLVPWGKKANKNCLWQHNH